MDSLKFTFARAASGKSGSIQFALLLLALAIDDDRQDREEKRRKDRNAKPSSGPRPR